MKTQGPHFFPLLGLSALSDHPPCPLGASQLDYEEFEFLFHLLSLSANTLLPSTHPFLYLIGLWSCSAPTDKPLWHLQMLLARVMHSSALPEIILSGGWQDSAQTCSLGASVLGCGWQGWVIPSAVLGTGMGIPQERLAESWKCDCFHPPWLNPG